MQNMSFTAPKLLQCSMKLGAQVNYQYHDVPVQYKKVPVFLLVVLVTLRHVTYAQRPVS